MEVVFQLCCTKLQYTEGSKVHIWTFEPSGLFELNVKQQFLLKETEVLIGESLRQFCRVSQLFGQEGFLNVYANTTLV